MNRDTTVEKRLVAFSFVFVFVSVLSMAIMLERNVEISKYDDVVFNAGAPVELRQTDMEASNPNKLKAMIKGSIYSTGENMTVFGACFDGDGYLLPEADALFTSWYPNGTIMTGPNATMLPITEDWSGTYVNGTGRWRIHVTMESTLGTYLTEIRCELGSEWAVAFGEWQNPEWVERIGNISVNVANMSAELYDFRNETNNQFTDVLNAINNFQTSGTEPALNELREAIRALDPNIWVLDETNPFYSLGSGINDLNAVDMMNEYSVHAVGDGFAIFWDGETWEMRNLSGYDLRGVSVAPANAPFAWYVGSNKSSNKPVYSINGATPVQPTLPGPASTATYFNDIKVFQHPNNPSGEWFVYWVANDGKVYFSDDTASTISYLTTLDATEDGRISQVVANYADGAEINGYMVMIGQGNDIYLHDGSSGTAYTVTGNVTGVSLLYGDLGYAVAVGSGESYIYKYNGTGMQLDYTIEDAGLAVTGVEALQQNDIWVSTADPSTFYHFDGERWEYSAVPYGEYASVIVTFGNASAAIDLNDISMSSSSAGYAVGDDGIVLKFKRHYDDRLDDLLTNVTYQFQNLTELISQIEVNVNLSINASNIALQETLLAINQSLHYNIEELYNLTVQINTTVNNIETTVVAMNASLSVSLDEILAVLAAMNASFEYKLDNILTNVTYTQLYLEATLFPLINSTYENTILILQRLGILEAQINQTIELQNTTLNIVNQTQQDVAELVNRSRRIRAWITQ